MLSLTNHRKGKKDKLDCKLRTMGEKREPIFRGGENSAMKLSHINKVLLIINKSAFLFF